MVALLFVVPILLIYLYAKKRHPTPNELGFWMLFLIPIAMTLAAWFEGEVYNWMWWVYLICWISATVVLLEKPRKKGPEIHPANQMWKNSSLYPPDGEKWYQKGWILYLLYGVALILFLLLYQLF